MCENLAEHRITGLKLFDVSADGFNSSGEVSTEDRVFWFEQSHIQTDQKYSQRLGDASQPHCRRRHKP